ncbi:MAG: hypothetical protein AAB316_20900, partial [Bacteroidota bacterium]
MRPGKNRPPPFSRSLFSIFDTEFADFTDFALRLIQWKSATSSDFNVKYHGSWLGFQSHIILRGLLWANIYHLVTRRF